MHYVFCISGFSGVGKDEFCRRLVENHGAIHTGLADPAKRHMADVYGFTRDQLFGPSVMRNAGDPRYPKTILTKIGARPAKRQELLLKTGDDDYTDPEKTWWCVDLPDVDSSNLDIDTAVVMGDLDLLPSCKIDGVMRFFIEDTNPKFFLSPREALQLYCNLMNDLYLCTWVRYGIDVHRKLAEFGHRIDDKEFSGGAKLRFSYDRMQGLVQSNGSRSTDGEDIITCFSDFRHWHEIRYVHEAEKKFDDFKAVLIRVKRPGIEEPPFNHRSETEQATIPDAEFDYVVENNDTVEGLHGVVDTIVEQVKASMKQ